MKFPSARALATDSEGRAPMSRPKFNETGELHGPRTFDRDGDLPGDPRTLCERSHDPSCRAECEDSLVS